jgi:ribose transport system substrate-binding protein
LSASVGGGCSKPPSSPGEPAEGTASAGAAKRAADATSKRLTLAMIPKGTQASFWNSVHDGAVKAEQQLGVRLVWKGPVTENDRDSQKQVMQQFLDHSVDGILLAPTDSRLFAAECRGAMEKGIPVLIFDSALEGEAGKDFVSLVATDNRAAGELGGKHLMELVGKGGKTILFRHTEGHASTADREAGALAEFEKGGAEVLEKDRYSGESTSESLATALNMIDLIRQADGVFASNQTSSEGLLLALRQTNLAGKVKFVGFDCSPLLLEGLRQGQIAALVVQDPVEMGRQSVALMVDKLHGKEVSPRIDMPAKLLTLDNVDDPAMRPLLP